MTDTSVTERTDYQATAAELRRVADALDTLPPADKPPYVQLSILPDHTIEAVDAVALAVLGETGTTQRDSDGWRHKAEGGDYRSVWVSIHSLVPGPPDKRDVELERLRAEVAELRAAATDGFSDLSDRLAVGTTPVPDTTRGLAAPVRAGELAEVHTAEQDAETEDAPVHYRFGMHDTACGLKPGKVAAASADHAKVTCPGCIDGLPSR